MCDQSQQQQQFNAGGGSQLYAPKSSGYSSLPGSTFQPQFQPYQQSFFGSPQFNQGQGGFMGSPMGTAFQNFLKSYQPPGLQPPGGSGGSPAQPGSPPGGTGIPPPSGGAGAPAPGGGTGIPPPSGGAGAPAPGGGSPPPGGSGLRPAPQYGAGMFVDANGNPVNAQGQIVPLDQLNGASNNTQSLVQTNGQYGFGPGNPVPISGVMANMLGLTQDGKGNWRNAQGQIAGLVQQ